MKTRVLLALIISVALSACSKDKFQTVPQLKVKSKNTDVVALNGTLRVTLEYTDKEGDVSDSLFIVRHRLNVNNGPIYPGPSAYKIPDFPNTDKGQIQMEFRYSLDLTFQIPRLRIIGTPNYEQDTMLLKFVVRDKAGNVSDTASTKVYVNRE